MIRRHILASFGTVLAVPALRAAETVERRETIERTFPLTGTGPARLLVDNIHGGIKVTGDGGRTIRLKAEKLIKARTNEKADVAQREIRLDIDQQGNEVRLYVDGPFRNPQGMNDRGWDYNGYNVRFDYELLVPRDIDLVLKTVNAGAIDVDNIQGDFLIRHVNGPVTARRLAGQGSLQTVNGAMSVEMDVPRGPTSFKTLNGKLEVRFPASLSADLKIKNRWNGAVYTDFEVQQLPSLPASIEQTGSTTRYRVNEFVPFRVRNGGPELTFETFNGTIRILSNSR